MGSDGLAHEHDEEPEPDGQYLRHIEAFLECLQLIRPIYIRLPGLAPLLCLTINQNR